MDKAVTVKTVRHTVRIQVEASTEIVTSALGDIGGLHDVAPAGSGTMSDQLRLTSGKRK